MKLSNNEINKAVEEVSLEEQVIVLEEVVDGEDEESVVKVEYILQDEEDEENQDEGVYFLSSLGKSEEAGYLCCGQSSIKVGLGLVCEWIGSGIEIDCFGANWYGENWNLISLLRTG